MTALPTRRRSRRPRPLAGLFLAALLWGAWTLAFAAEDRRPAKPAPKPASREARGSSPEASPPSRPRKGDSGQAPSRSATRKAAPQSRAPSDRPTATDRARWARLPEEKRRAIQQLYERIRGLPPAQRTRILESLKALDAAERQRVLREAAERSKRDPIESETLQARRQLLRRRLSALSPQQREALREMSAEERKRLLQERAADERERQIATLPPAEREALRRLSPREQTARLRQIKGIELLRATFQEPRETLALKRLRPRELVAALRPQARPPERPAFVTPQSWKRWLELKPYEQTRVLRAIASSWPPAPSSSPSSSGEPAHPEHRPRPTEGQK